MKTKLFFLVALSVGLVSSISKAQTSVVDQQNVPSNTNSTISPGQTFGQSFTAGVTGTLTGVGVGLNFGAPVTSCIVKVFSGSGYGGTLLATKSFTTTGPGLNSVTLTTGVPIVSGNVYTFQFSSFGSPIPVNYHSGNTYAGGAFFNNGTLIPSADAIFETRVKFIGTPGQFNSAVYNLIEMNDMMNFSLVSGASNYKVKVTGVTTTFSNVNTRNSNWNTLFSMAYIPGIQYGQTYNIQLAYYKNGAWQGYGPISVVNTPAIIPTPQLTTCSPSFTVASKSTIFTWNKVTGASNYKVIIKDNNSSFSATNVRNSSNNTFCLAYVKGTLPGVTYDITIQAYVGGVWGTEGFPCHVTAMSARTDDGSSIDSELARLGSVADEQVESEISVDLYPNPSNGNFNINLSENASIIVTNMLGDIIINTKADAGLTLLNIENQPAGIYFTTITANNSKKVLKIIKQ